MSFDVSLNVIINSVNRYRSFKYFSIASLLNTNDRFFRFAFSYFSQDLASGNYKYLDGRSISALRVSPSDVINSKPVLTVVRKSINNRTRQDVTILD